MTMQEDLELFRSELQAWMQSTNDPLSRGPVPPPPHAKLNDLSDYDPE
jgi:hypothetical protein